MPFAVADPKKDMLYRLLATGQTEKFWNIHASVKGDSGIYSEEFKDLFATGMEKITQSSQPKTGVDLTYNPG